MKNRGVGCSERHYIFHYGVGIRKFAVHWISRQCPFVRFQVKLRWKLRKSLEVKKVTCRKVQQGKELSFWV